MRGPGIGRQWLGGIIAYAIAVPVGATVTTIPLHLVGWLLGRPPIQAVGATALAMALIGSKVLPLPLPQSQWQVPKSWARFGHTAFAALFGGVLGLGVLTAISAPGFFALLMWGLAATHWEDVWPVFAAFGVGRVIPLLALAFTLKQSPDYPVRIVEGSNAIAKVAFHGEAMLLAAITVLLLHPA